MPRTARTVSETGYYHVIQRGNGRRYLFESDIDRRRYLALLQSCASDSNIQIIAWCLMQNHVHMILDGSIEGLSEMMLRMGTSYARYFNESTGHTGSVFEDRFSSIPLRDDRQLLACVKYIHNNPMKAGLADFDEYSWSSYHEYVMGNGIVDPEPVLKLLQGVEGFIAFSHDDRFSQYYVRKGKRVASGDEVIAARAALGGCSPATVASQPKQERDRCLCSLHLAGLTADQIVRMTGIGRSTVYNAIRTAK